MNVWTRIFGHKNYRQFVVICHPRTGSNMLSSYLDSHPSIKMHGEMFSKLNGRSIRDIYRVFRKKKPRQIKASGFKLFYTHPEDGDNEEMLRLIESMPQPIIIHLIRKDKLRTLVSMRIAMLTDIWGHKEGSPLISSEQKMVTITPEEALTFHSEIKRYESTIEERFKKYSYTTLLYEDLVDNPEASMLTIFQLLNLPDYPVKSAYIRSNPEPLQELVLNFQELTDKGILEKFRAN